MEGTLAEIRMFGGNFSPSYWAYCSGQILSVNSNVALFSLLNKTYGGNGSTTFALPDLRGKVVVGAGQGQGLTNKPLGTTGGSYNVTLALNNMPLHTHTIGAGGTTRVSGSLKAVMNVNNSDGTEASPQNNYLGVEQSGSYLYAAASSNTDTLNAGAITINSPNLLTDLSAMQIGPTGNSVPFSNMQPYLSIGYIICINGIYPSRD